MQKTQLAKGNDARLLITIKDEATGQPIDVSAYDRIDVFLGRKGAQAATLRWSSADSEHDDLTIEDGDGEISVIINRDDTFAMGDFEYFYTVKCWRTDDDYRAGNAAISSKPVYVFEIVSQFDSIAGE